MVRPIAERIALELAAEGRFGRAAETALAAVGAGLEHVVKWNVFVVEGKDFAKGYEVFQRVWGDRTSPPPLITAAVVKGLAHPDFLAEMDAIAVVQD